jgi:integral membrane sensor domain MASE1
VKPYGWVKKWLRRVPSGRAYWIRGLILAVLYIASASAGLSLAHTTRQITEVWPASGLALVAILVLGYRYWPSILVGAFVANAFATEPVMVAIAIAIGNTLEALAGAWIMRRLGQAKCTMDTPQAVGVLGLAAAGSALLAATIGSLSLAVGGVIAWSEWASNWLIWWSGDVMGMLLFAPLLFVLLDPSVYSKVLRRPVEAGIVLATLLAASTWLLTAPSGPFVDLHFYLLFPFLVWAAVRFTRLGVITCTTLIAAVGIWAIASGLGPLRGHPTDQALLQFLIFLLVTTATSLLLAIAIDQQQQAVSTLQTQARKLERLDAELKDANRRITDILAGILKGGRLDQASLRRTLDDDD